MKYPIMIDKNEEGFSAWCPGLPGCWSQGNTEQEALDNIRDAIEGYLAARSELFCGKEIREVEVTGPECQ